MPDLPLMILNNKLIRKKRSKEGKVKKSSNIFDKKLKTHNNNKVETEAYQIAKMNLFGNPWEFHWKD